MSIFKSFQVSASLQSSRVSIIMSGVFWEAEKQPNAPRKRLSVDNVLIRHG